MNSLIHEQSADVTAMVNALRPHLTHDDNPALWKTVLETVLLDLHILSLPRKLLSKQFLKIGSCSHWFRPHQSRWAAAGTFAWPSGWHNVEGHSLGGLPELDWSVLFEKIGNKWKIVEKFSGKERLEVRVSVPSRSARHNQAAIHSLWNPGNELIFYGFRKKDEIWSLAARSDFNEKDKQ